jgi:antitoxin (DNA-binding transcriptional repressor) of toxin-antitoxin stability system
MKINEVDPRNFDSDVDYYAALNAKPKARVPSEPRPSPAQQDADDEDSVSQQRQSAQKAFTQKRAVKYIDKEGSAPNGEKYNKLYVIQARDTATADHEEYMFGKNEWGAKKVIDVEKSKNEDGSVTHTLYIVDNHKHGMWKPWKGEPAESVTEDANDSPVASAITRRILMQRADLLAKHGPAKVTAAIDDVADFVGDVEEIGSSDVSGWVKQVEQNLAGMGESVAEAGYIGGHNRDEPDYSGIDNVPQRIRVRKGSRVMAIPPSALEQFKADGWTEVDQAVSEAAPRVDSLVTDALKIMRGTDVNDAIRALKTVLGDREYNGRRGHYNFYVKQLVDLSNQSDISPRNESEQTNIKEADMDSEQGRQNILSILKAAEQGQDAQITVGNEPITLEAPEARFVSGRYKSFLQAGRQDEFLRALTDARAFDRIMAKMRATLDKQKNFRGSVPGERGVEEGNGDTEIHPGMKVSQGTVVKVNGNTVTVKTSNGDMMNMNIHDVDQAVKEGIVDTIKAGAKKAFDKLGGGSDEELLQRLEKETGGQRPEKKDNRDVKDVDEALFRASAQLKDSQYFCMMDKQVKLIPEGYKRNTQGYLVRK